MNLAEAARLLKLRNCVSSAAKRRDRVQKKGESLDPGCRYFSLVVFRPQVVLTWVVEGGRWASAYFWPSCATWVGHGWAPGSPKRLVYPKGQTPLAGWPNEGDPELGSTNGVGPLLLDMYLSGSRQGLRLSDSLWRWYGLLVHKHRSLHRMMWNVGCVEARAMWPNRFHCIWRACVDQRMPL